MVGTQRDWKPAIQDFLRWEASQETYRVGTGGSRNGSEPHYIPLPDLERYLTPARVEEILKDLFPDDVPDKDYLRSHYLRPFATLLSARAGDMIKTFLSYEELQDQHLPLRHEPRHFPKMGFVNLWTRFYEKQWKYYPVTLRYNMNNDLDDDEILPFHLEEQLGQGGSATAHKITVEACYNEIQPYPKQTLQERARTRQLPNTFVLKIFRGTEARSNYFKERKAFEKLKFNGVPPDNIIGFYGGFSQHCTYNLILEYADRGTLAEFIQRTPPPSNGECILTFWKRIFRLKEGLNAIHNIGAKEIGWHQDVNLANILVRSRNGDSNYDCDFLLADLGSSHFRTTDRTQQDTTDRDTYGTYAYGAPETYRHDHNMQYMHLQVQPTVDIWSLGCVYSEVATWIVHGWNRVLEYRRQRRTEVAQSIGPGCGDLFHNGENVLEVVSECHKHIISSRRIDDHITEKVLTGLVEEMLSQKPEERPAAAVLCAKARRIVEKAETELTKPTLSPTPQEGAGQSPPLTPSSTTSQPPWAQNEPSSRSPEPEEPESEDPNPKHPQMSIRGCLEWTRNEKWRSKSKPPNAEHLQKLKGRDHVFLVDNTETMNQYKAEVKDVVEALSNMVNKNHVDPDGVDILFTQSSREILSKKKVKLSLLNRTTFVGISDMGSKLGQILEDYRRKITHPSLFQRFFSSGTPRPLSLYILTDGKWQPRSDVETSIRTLVELLQQHKLLNQQVGIQFIRFGNDRRAIKGLDHLDSQLNTDIDIVDHTPSDGNCWKMLLGAVNRWFDDDNSNPSASPPRPTSGLTHR